jgi:uridylate kinase
VQRKLAAPAAFFISSRTMPKYKRILLKLSGEAFAGKAGFGIDAGRMKEMAAEIVAAGRSGTQFGIVVGGGNFFRGVNAASSGIQRVTVDYMGMLATAINALALCDLLQQQGGKARVMSAVAMEPLVPRFSLRDATQALEAGEIVIFAAGTGSPFFSTDTAASLRAIEIEADLLAKATKVDGVYDKDPVRFPKARRYEKISFADVLSRELGVMDAAAISLCKERSLPVLVFNLNVPGNIKKLVAGKKIGTLVS